MGFFILVLVDTLLFFQLLLVAEIESLEVGTDSTFWADLWLYIRMFFFNPQYFYENVYIFLEIIENDDFW